MRRCGRGAGASFCEWHKCRLQRKMQAGLNAGHWGFAPRPKGCSPPPCGGLKIAFLALCSVNGCPISPTTWGLSAYCPLTHTGTLAAICRTKSGLFDAFWCSFDAFWCSLAAGLRYRVAAARGSGQDCCGGQRRRAACAQDQAGRSGATATDPSGRAHSPRRAQGGLRPRPGRGARSDRKQTQAGGRIARAERRAACAQDQAGEQGATASRPKREGA